MMKVAQEIWKEIEKELKKLKDTTPEFSEIETELLTPCDLLSLGEKDSMYISSMLKNFPDIKWMSPSEISMKYPCFENIPENYIGSVSEEAGIVRVKNAITGFKILSQQYGADLRYNCHITEVEKNKVKCEDGNIFHANHVVVTWGGYTKEYFDKNESKTKVVQTETFTFSGGRKGMPGCFIEESSKYTIYGLMDGQNLTDYHNIYC